MNLNNGFEQEIRQRGAIKSVEFVTHAGLPANQKLELDNDFLKSDMKFARLLASQLAGQIENYEPQVIIPLPNGANLLGKLVADALDVEYVLLERADKRAYSFKSLVDQALVETASSVGLVDDVFSTGSSLREASSLTELKNKVVVAGVIWDRSDSAIPKKLNFPLHSVVQKYLPLYAKT